MNAICWSDKVEGPTIDNCNVATENVYKMLKDLHAKFDKLVSEMAFIKNIFFQ